MVEVINGQDYKSINSMFDLYNIEYGEKFKETNLFRDSYKTVVDYVLKLINNSIEESASNEIYVDIRIEVLGSSITLDSYTMWQASEKKIVFRNYGYAVCKDLNKLKGILWAIVSELFKNGQIQNWQHCIIDTGEWDGEYEGYMYVYCNLIYAIQLNKYKEL